MVAPTELLAEQHYAALEVIAEQLPLPLRPRVALLTGDLRIGSKVGTMAAGSPRSDCRDAAT